MSLYKRISRAAKEHGFDPFNRARRDAYSQEGEDLILRRAFGKHKRDGFYVDVGAYHPKRASNTYLFYRRGWRGINIDFRPGSMRLFNKLRPRDINLEFAISDRPGAITFHCFAMPVLDTFSPERVQELEAQGQHVIRRIEVTAVPLRELLHRHLPDGQRIDFMSIDVEYYELAILRSNDWSRFRPTYLVVETLDWKLTDAADTPVVRMIKDLGYEIIARTINTSIWRDRAG